MKKIQLGTQVIIVAFLFLILLQSCFSFRATDKVKVDAFKNKGILLQPFFYTTKNKSLHYVQVGADTLPTIVFVHGSPGSWTEFEAYLKDSQLMHNYRLISIDRPGFGYSDYRNAVNLQNQANQIGEVLLHLQNKKPLYLVGHSLGGPLVALLAADYSYLISSIVIMAGALSPQLEPKEKWRKLFLKAPFKKVLPGAFRQSNVELCFLKTDLVTLKDKLNQIVCPVYIMHAKNDMLVDVKNVDYMQQNFTAATVYTYIYNKGNHFIHFNKHKELVAILMTLLH